MRIYALTVGRNEASRYLLHMLDHVTQVFDDVYFYDDRSEDETPGIVHDFNCSGRIRPPDWPGFMDNEGAFRQDAWRCFEEDLGPRPGDWVCVIDCDEILVSEHGSHPSEVRDTLEKVINAAGHHVGVDLTIPEVWGYGADGTPLVRVDGLWNTIHAPRLFPYRPGASYYVGESFGVPAVPSYVMGGPWFGTDLLYLMHYGYAEEQDQLAKFGRYSGQQGHANQHVQSIIGEQTLAPWPGYYWATMRATWRP